MAYVLGKDLDNFEDSIETREPYMLKGDGEIGAQYLTGTDLMRSAKISPEWKTPVATYAQSYQPLYISGQIGRSLLTALEDEIHNMPYNVMNMSAQNVVELLGDEKKEKKWQEKLFSGTDAGKLLKGVGTLASLGVIIPGLREEGKAIREKVTTYDEMMDLLKDREYPLTKYAKRVIADTTNHVENRELVRELYKQSQGIDSSAWYNQAATIIGAMTPAIVATKLGYTGALMGGATRAGAVNTAINITKGLIGLQEAGRYAEETAAQYLRRTGDKNFEKFTAKDATGLGAIVYGAINAEIEFMGGVEPIMAGALSKVGLRTGLIKAGLKIGAGEATEELLQGITELLMRKMDGTTDKTWGEGILEALKGAAWGMFIGGVTGTPTFYMNRRNLVKGIKKVLPNISDTEATKVADIMIDSVGETASQNQTLRQNLRDKISFMMETSDIANKEDRIDSITDLEYALIAADASIDGIDIKNHPLFQGEVNKLGWFRAGIPEESRAVVNDLLAELNDLETQLKTLNEAKEKDWEKIDEIERRLEQFDRYVLDKLGENAPASLRELDNELRKVENKYVAKEKKKKAGIPVDTVEPTQQNVSPLQSLGYQWSGVLLTKDGKTGHHAFRNKTDALAFVEEAKKHGYTEENIQVVGFDEKPLFQPEQFDLADENARLDDIYPAYTGETIEVDGKERTVYNSNGDRIAKSAEALTNFWKWFGDSKVVDKKGRPLVVYHGTTETFNEFMRSADIGFHFGSKRAAKHRIIGEKTKIFMPVYLKIINPLITKKDYGNWEATKPDPIMNPQPLVKGLLKDSLITQDMYDEFMQKAKPGVASYNSENTKILHNILNKAGYDGIFYPNWFEDIGGRYSYIIFDSTQVKSVDNRGTFSEKTGNIYWQNRPSGAAPSTYRGAYIPQYRFIQRTNKMDASTLSHELAHDWFEINFDKFRSGKASPEFMRAWGALEKVLGITDKSTKAEKAKASEAFARAYEGWIMNNKGWEKLINVDDKDKDDIIKLMLDYQSDLRDIYQDLTNPYFKQTWGKLGEMKPEIKAWFDKVVNITDIDKLVERGEMTPEQASQEKLNQAIDTVIENTEDAETKKTLKTMRVLNDTKRYEAEGGNKNALQVRLANLAQAIDENNMLIKENYDTHRDMLEVAKQADNFVKTRLEDALAIINGQMAEQEGLFKEDIYTALERLALENGDLNLLDELKNSEVANRLAKELGQRVAGFRNWNAGDVDVVSSLKALDNKFNKALQNKKAQAQMAEAEQMFAKAQEQQDKLADKELDSFLKDVECK